MADPSVLLIVVVCVGARRSIVFLLVVALRLAWRLLLDSRDGSLLIDPCSRPSVKGAQRLSPGLTLTQPSASARFQDPPSQRNPFLLIASFFFFLFFCKFKAANSKWDCTAAPLSSKSSVESYSCLFFGASLCASECARQPAGEEEREEGTGGG